MKTLLALISLTFASAAQAFTYTIEIPEAELQRRVEALMPLEKSRYFITLVLSEPRVELIGSVNEIGIGLQVEARAPGGLKGSGETRLAGSVIYDPEQGAFFMNNPKLKDLHVNGVADKYQPRIRRLAQSAIANLLRRHPIYRFNEDDVKQKLAKAVLKSVVVKDRQLVVELGLF